MISVTEDANFLSKFWGSAFTRGRVKVNLAPLAEDSAQIRPPCAVDDSFGDVEPQARADLARRPGLPVAIEHMREMVGGNAGAGVGDRDQQLVAAALRADRDCASFGA